MKKCLDVIEEEIIFYQILAEARTQLNTFPG